MMASKKEQRQEHEGGKNSKESIYLIKKGRNKSRDHRSFDCSHVHEIGYISSLYDDKQAVYEYLIRKFRIGVTSYQTHMELYKMIEKDLSFPIPPASDSKDR